MKSGDSSSTKKMELVRVTPDALLTPEDGVFLFRAPREHSLARICYAFAASGSSDVATAEEDPIGAVKWVIAGGGICSNFIKLYRKCVGTYTYYTCIL